MRIIKLSNTRAKIKVASLAVFLKMFGNTLEQRRQKLAQIPSNFISIKKHLFAAILYYNQLQARCILRPQLANISPQRRQQMIFYT